MHFSDFNLLVNSFIGVFALGCFSCDCLYFSYFHASWFYYLFSMVLLYTLIYFIFSRCSSMWFNLFYIPYCTNLLCFQTAAFCRVKALCYIFLIVTDQSAGSKQKLNKALCQTRQCRERFFVAVVGFKLTRNVPIRDLMLLLSFQTKLTTGTPWAHQSQSFDLRTRRW